jgi:hypothetical protein
VSVFTDEKLSMNGNVQRSLRLRLHRSAPVPRFYINFRNGDQIAKDDIGIELPSLEDARAVALISAREIVADNIKGNAKNPLEAVIITGESGEELMTIPARDVLPDSLKK